MLLALVAVVCAGLVAVPATWAVRKQLEADRGEASPESAALIWVLKLSAGDELGLSRVLAKPRHDLLLRQWRDYRATIDSTGKPPSKITTTGPSVVEHQGDDRAMVTEQVQAIWWDGPTALAGTPQPWRFEVRRDRGGWRIWLVELPPWCGGHVRADLCPART
ncbi:hypothetical protein OG994_25545 [Micromonospora globbae]|uniref:Uncharacterized protein n=1 Tax=Micromonospora globbae TaxID=1894969 RepID=A0ABZ1S4Q4_9ACTN|nr:hypothetical protein [Micromonospora globbae]